MGENNVGGLIGHDGFPRSCGTEKRVCVERRLLALHGRGVVSIIASAADALRRFGMVVSGLTTCSHFHNGWAPSEQILRVRVLIGREALVVTEQRSGGGRS